MKKFIFSKVAGLQLYSWQLELLHKYFQGFYLDFKNAILSHHAYSLCFQQLWENLRSIINKSHKIFHKIICKNVVLHESLLQKSHFHKTIAIKFSLDL